MVTTIRLAHTVQVNPPGAAGPVLTEEQVYKGFQRKIRRPWEFVPAIETSEILEEDPASGITARRVVFKAGAVGGQPPSVIEVCKEMPPHRVDYMLDNGSEVWNIIGAGDAPESLFVTYAFAWKHEELQGENAQPSSSVYQAVMTEHRRVAKAAVEASIAVTRQLVASGEI